MNPKKLIENLKLTQSETFRVNIVAFLIPAAVFSGYLIHRSFYYNEVLFLIRLVLSLPSQ